MKELSYLETIKGMDEIKKYFESQIESRLSLIKVPCPLFVRSDTGLQDMLSGYEKAVCFTKGKEQFEIVHSLAKWKRVALKKYDFPLYSGLITDMKAIRKDEELDSIHSMYVEQWDWEKVISKDDRTIDYLKETVRGIYKAIRQTLIHTKKIFPMLSLTLPKSIYFITSQELEDLYPDKTPKEREYLITKEKIAVFIIGIGDKLKSGHLHDTRSPDYDDWQLDGDLLIYDKRIDKALEMTSMGIRVDKDALLKQLKKSKCLDRLGYKYHQDIIEERLPYTIGGGIGVSRLYMLILDKKHLSEVQPSYWELKGIKELKTL